MSTQHLTMSPELDAWLSDRRAKEAAIEHAAQLWNDGEGPRRVTSPAWTHEAELTDAEWRFLWKRFRPVGTPMIGFARRLQRTGPDDIMAMSPEQRRWVLALAFKYRRKVCFNPAAGKLDEATFVKVIRQLAGKQP